MTSIYLDHAATTPVDPVVAELLAELSSGERFGNPSSRHRLGVRAADRIDRAREQVARAVGARPEGVTFTSGGTEANNLAVLGFARAASPVTGRGGNRGRIIVGATEHPSVREPALELAAEGFEVVTTRIDDEGALDFDHFVGLLDETVVLVAQMVAQNEIGSVYPIRRVARAVRLRSPRAHLHADAVQAFGKLDCSPTELGADSVSISAHKIHGPKGVGALVLRDPGRTPRPLVFGGGQERGLRSGTENVAGICGLGLAAELAERARPRLTELSREFRAELVRAATNRIPGASVLEPGSSTMTPLCSICALHLPGVPAEVRTNHLDSRGLVVSPGAACQSRKRETSPALLAIGLSVQSAREVIRISFARTTTREEVERAVEILVEVSTELEALRK